MLTDSCKPERVCDIIGLQKAKDVAKSYLKNFKGKACFLIGKPGIGKTSLVHAIAKENDYELKDVNASFSRSVKTVEKLKSFVQNPLSLIKDGKLLLLDELDGAPKKFITKLNKELIPNTTVPIFVVANVLTKNLYGLYSSCVYKAFLYPSKNRKLLKGLQRIVNKNGLDVTKKTLMKVIYNNNGDIRNMLNDLDKLRYCEKVSCTSMPDNYMSNYQIVKEYLTNQNLDYLLKIGEVIGSTKVKNIKYWLFSTILSSFKDEELWNSVKFLTKADEIWNTCFKEQRFDLMKYYRLALCFNSAVETYFSKYGNVVKPDIFFKSNYTVSGVENIKGNADKSQYSRKKKKNINASIKGDKIVL